MTDFVPGEIIKDVFYHPNAGLTTADFDIALFKNSLPSAKTVTVVEQSTNFYSLSFQTDTDDAIWALDIAKAGTQTPRHQGTWSLRSLENVNISAVGGSSSTSLLKDLAYIRQMVERTKEFLVRKRG